MAATVQRTGGRVEAVRAWLDRRADTRLARLALLWLRTYLDASRNSGSAATLYGFLSIVPTAFVAVAVLDGAGGDTNAFAEHLIGHMRLTGATADLVRDMFGTASANALAATAAAIVGFLFWGIGIGGIYQSVYARAWRVELGGAAADQGRFTAWFFAVAGVLGLQAVAAAQLRAAGWLVLVPVWVAGSTVFWLWTPRFLLRRAVGVRALLPGALLAAFVLGGTVATSPFWIAPTLNEQGRAFGAFGVALGLLAYGFIVVTISLACAVFSPVWAEWRRGEAARGPARKRG